MSVLAVSDFLNPGQRYTFAFNVVVGLNPVGPGSDELVTDLQAVGYLADVTVKKPLFSNTVEISFTYQGDSSNVVANAAYDITNAVEGAHWLLKFPFVEADSGETGINEKSAQPTADVFGSIKTAALWAAVIIGLLVLFEVSATVREVA